MQLFAKMTPRQGMSSSSTSKFFSFSGGGRSISKKKRNANITSSFSFTKGVFTDHQRGVEQVVAHAVAASSCKDRVRDSQTVGAGPSLRGLCAGWPRKWGWTEQHTKKAWVCLLNGGKKRLKPSFLNLQTPNWSGRKSG